MRPEGRSNHLLAVTRSKAKMFEYLVPEQHHIAVDRDPARLLRLAVGMLGDLASAISRGDTSLVEELSESLRFAARYFDAYSASKLARVSDSHLLLLAAATYYLCDLPGSSSVLVSRVPFQGLDLDAGGLERFLWWVLRGNFSEELELGEVTAKYHAPLSHLTRSLRTFYELGDELGGIQESIDRLRELAYSRGTPRELLFADACSAIIARRIDNSARRSLPKYSRLPLEVWTPVLRKPSFVSELWPAQHLLGQKTAFAGVSSVVQMPTSAGKSRASEMVIRSSFLSGRSSLAVVVAPFRALCREIRDSLVSAFAGEDVRINELSDVLQRDFRVEELVAGRGILVLTPEKLVYVLRHIPELADHIGLLILDEGHQFDAGSRGVTYELLVTSLNSLVASSAQKVLISAVIANPDEVGQWLNGDAGAVVAGPDLLPTERSIAFASWRTRVGQLHFVTPEDPDEEEFFVPRVIRSTPLNLRPRERTERRFPSKSDIKSVALYLGLRVVGNGAVAVFCGRKDSARALCEMLVDVADRGLELPMPVVYADEAEVARLAHLYEQNLGAEAPSARAARLGACTHHGNTPHGVRLAVEHSLKEGLGRFVICTSTLAQGVNLPIRYLVVTSARQGGELLKVRDFHNLMGRAGRSGMHIEGSVLVADPEVYDSRASSETKWSEFKDLLRKENSEPCSSTLLSLLHPLHSNGRQVSLEINAIALVHAHMTDVTGSGNWIDETAEALSRRWFSKETLRRQLAERRDTIVAIESYLMAHWVESEADAESEIEVEAMAHLAKETLAFHLASSNQQDQLLHAFELLAENVAARVPDPVKRQVYGRTLFGVGYAIALEGWVAENRGQIAACENDDQLFEAVWPCIAARIQNSTFRKWRPPETTKNLAKRWLTGDSFGALLQQMEQAQVRIGVGEQPRRPRVEHIVEMGENALGFDGAHILGAVTELFELLGSEDEQHVTTRLQNLHKRLKYGLPSHPAFLLYESGFSDRPLAIALADLMPEIASRAEMIVHLRDTAAVQTTLAAYPSYFTWVFERLVS